MRKKFLSKRTGFTVLELLVTMTIILVLSAILFLGHSSEEEKLRVQRSVYLIGQYLRETQEMAMAAVEQTCPQGVTHSFGVYFHKQTLPNSFIIFADCNSNQTKDSADVEIRTIELEKNVKILDSNPFPLNIVFTPPEPTTYINGSSSPQQATIIVSLENNEGVQQTVQINTVGKIEIH